MAYFKWTDGYNDSLNEFGSLFIAVVPEPSIGVVLLTVGLLVTGRRRRDVR
jgi:hypothetical protein